jgi:hypothetical protein
MLFYILQTENTEGELFILYQDNLLSSTSAPPTSEVGTAAILLLAILLNYIVRLHNVR